MRAAAPALQTAAPDASDVVAADPADAAAIASTEAPVRTVKKRRKMLKSTW